MNIQPIYFIAAPFIGFVGMTLGAYWGIGCSWLIVPLMLLLGSTSIEAAGVALLQMVPSIIPVLVRDAPSLGWQKNSLGRNLILPLALGGILASLGGCFVNVFLYKKFGNLPFQCLFALVLILIALRILLGKSPVYKANLPAIQKKEAPKAFGLGALSGFFSSLFGIGGGMFFRPILSEIFKIPEKETASAARLLLFFTAFAGGISYIFVQRNFNWQIGAVALLISLGGVFGFLLGTKIHKDVVENGYANHVRGSFVFIAILVLLNLTLNIFGFVLLGRSLMIISALLLLSYLLLFAQFAKKKKDFTSPR